MALLMTGCNVPGCVYCAAAKAEADRVAALVLKQNKKT